MATTRTTRGAGNEPADPGADFPPGWPLDADVVLQLLTQVLEQAPAHGGEKARAAAALTLGRSGEARAMPWLLTAFTDWNDIVRKAAVDAFVALGADHTLPVLSEAVEMHDHSWARGCAAEALGKLGDARAIAVLIASLEDVEWLVRADAAEALGKLRAREAIPALVKQLGNKDVVSSATRALHEIADKAAIPALAAALEGEREYYRGLWFAQAIAAVGADAVEPLTRLLARGVLMDDLRPNVEELLEQARAATGPSASAKTTKSEPVNRPAEPRSAARVTGSPEALLGLLREGTPQQRIGAATAIGSLADAALAVAPLAYALRNDGAWGVRAAAATSLGALAPAGAAEILVRALRREGIASARRALCDALVQLGSTAVEPLARLVNDAKVGEEVRMSAAVTLGRVAASNPTASSAVSANAALVAGLALRNNAVRAAAAEALASHPDGARAVPADRWVALLGEGDPRLATASARALGAHGDGAVELLIDAANSTTTSRGARAAACGALAEIGGARARSALSELLSKNHETDHSLGSAAASAIVRCVELHAPRSLGA